MSGHLPVSPAVMWTMSVAVEQGRSEKLITQWTFVKALYLQQNWTNFHHCILCAYRVASFSVFLVNTCMFWECHCTLAVCSETGMLGWTFHQLKKRFNYGLVIFIINSVVELLVSLTGESSTKHHCLSSLYCSVCTDKKKVKVALQLLCIIFNAKVETWEALDLNQTPPIPLWKNLNLRLERSGKSLRPHTKGLANSFVSNNNCGNIIHGAFMTAQISSCSYWEESGLGTRLLHECVNFQLCEISSFGHVCLPSHNSQCWWIQLDTVRMLSHPGTVWKVKPITIFGVYSHLKNSL